MSFANGDPPLRLPLQPGSTLFLGREHAPGKPMNVSKKQVSVSLAPDLGGASLTSLSATNPTLCFWAQDGAERTAQLQRGEIKLLRDGDGFSLLWTSPGLARAVFSSPEGGAAAATAAGPDSEAAPAPKRARTEQPAANVVDLTGDDEEPVAPPPPPSAVAQPPPAAAAPPAAVARPRLLLLCGLQGAGKSTFASRLVPPTWDVVCQDTVSKGKPGSRPQCLAAVLRGLRAGKHVAVDRTHTSVEQRSDFLRAGLLVRKHTHTHTHTRARAPASHVWLSPAPSWAARLTRCGWTRRLRCARSASVPARRCRARFLAAAVRRWRPTRRGRLTKFRRRWAKASHPWPRRRTLRQQTPSPPDVRAAAARTKRMLRGCVFIGRLAADTPHSQTRRCPPPPRPSRRGPSRGPCLRCRRRSARPFRRPRPAAAARRPRTSRPRRFQPPPPPLRLHLPPPPQLWHGPPLRKAAAAAAAVVAAAAEAKEEAALSAVEAAAAQPAAARGTPRSAASRPTRAARPACAPSPTILSFSTMPTRKPPSMYSSSRAPRASIQSRSCEATPRRTWRCWRLCVQPRRLRRRARGRLTRVGSGACPSSRASIPCRPCGSCTATSSPRTSTPAG